MKSVDQNDVRSIYNWSETSQCRSDTRPGVMSLVSAPDIGGRDIFISRDLSWEQSDQAGGTKNTQMSTRVLFMTGRDRRRLQ